MEDYDLISDLEREFRTALEGCAEAPEERMAALETQMEALKEQVETVEQRLERAIACIHDNRKETERIGKLQRQHILQEQAVVVRRRRRRRTALRYLAAGIVGVILVAQAEWLGRWSWKVLCALGRATGIGAELCAGFAGILMALYLALRIIKSLCCRRNAEEERSQE